MKYGSSLNDILKVDSLMKSLKFASRQGDIGKRRIARLSALEAYTGLPKKVA